MSQTETEKKQRRPSMATITEFAEKMRTEGRGQEYEQTIRDVMDGRDCSRQDAIPEAMRLCGWDEYKPNFNRVKAIGFQNQAEFEEAFAKLPNEVAPNTEWEWIASHPAMMRLERAGKDVKKIKLKAADITNPPNGPAPSKRAVTQLQNECNKPSGFFKDMRARQKKQQEAAEGDAVAQKDEGLDVVRRILDEFMGQREGEK